MQSFISYRSFSLISVWCVALAVLGTSLVHAADFKPFLTLKIAGPGTIVGIAEKINSIADPSGSLGVKAMLAPYKSLTGVNANGFIGLTLQSNQNSPLGLDAILVLPISNLDTFNIPGQDVYVAMLKTMLQKSGSSYVIDSPIGNFVAYQKTGYLVIAPIGTAEFASTADPKKMFADLDKFTLGATFNWDNVSPEEIETMLGTLAATLAMQGMEFDTTEILENIAAGLDELSLSTMGVSIDERTLTITASALLVPQKGSEKAEKFQKQKNAKTLFSGFLQDTSKTVFSLSYMDYLTDSEVAEMAAAIQLIGGSFVEGLRETAEEEEEGEQFVRLAEIIFEWLQECVAFYAQKKSIDAAVSLDSDGTFLYAEAMEKPELLVKIGYNLYNALPELLGEEAGKAVQTLIDGKIKQDYETVAGFSLSCLPNPLAELPPGIAAPRALKSLPVSLFWATKNGEAVAVAMGLDFARTEKALKAALEKTKTPIQPKQTAVFGLKPLGEFLSKQVLPLAEKSGTMEKDEIDDSKELLAVISSADGSAKVVVATEFPNDAQLQKVQIDGKCINVVVKLLTKQGELTAKRFAREFMKQQQLQQQQRESSEDE